MKITVLGCGALGSLWLAALSRAGHQVQGWQKASDTVNFHLLEQAGLQLPYSLPGNQLTALKQCELLIVTLKALHIAPAVSQLAPQLPASCPILLLHNGLGVVEQLSALPQPLLRGITTHAAQRQGSVIQHTGAGTTQVGPLSANARSLAPLADCLHHALPKVLWQPEIEHAGWLKLAINSLINPLSVKYQCRNGELLEHWSEINQLATELTLVMQAAGIAVELDQVLEQTRQVITQTARNHSSMLQDIQHRRPTEIHYITGYLLREAEARGLELPGHRQLYNFITRKESAYVVTP